MIRIRNKQGDLITIPEDATFIELCSQDGKVGSVFYESNNNTTNVFNFDDPEAEVYGKRFKTEFVDKVIDLGNRYEEV